MAKIKKYQAGGRASKDSVESEMFPGKKIAKSAVQRFKTPITADTTKKAAPKKKAKSGGSFPDLNKDGKITRADILKGRGVIKKGGKIAAKKSAMKSGGKMGKCKYGCK